MHFPSLGPLLVVAVIVLLLFGRGRISEFMGDFAKGIKSFKKGLADDPKEEEREEAASVRTIDASVEETLKTSSTSATKGKI